MASGTINGYTSNEYIEAKVEWSSKADISTNKSTVTAVLYYKRNNTGFETYGTGSFYITINATRTTATKVLTITEDGWIKAMEASVTVSHLSDGTKAVSIVAGGSIPGTTLTSTSVSGTAKLDNIPKGAALNSVVAGYTTEAIKVTYTPKSTSCYHRLNIAVNLSGTYVAVRQIDLGKAPLEAQTVSITLTKAERETIYKQVTNSVWAKLRYTLRTYSDSGYANEIGNPSAKDATITMDAGEVNPWAEVIIAPKSSLPSPFDALYIKGKTKVYAVYTNFQGQYGATYKSYETHIGGKKYGAYDESDYITETGTVTVHVYVYDSRGCAYHHVQDLDFLDYEKPRILPVSGDSKIVCERCDSSGNLSDQGTYLKIKAKRQYSKVVASGSQKNFCSIRYRYKEEGGAFSSWTTILGTGAASDEVTTGALLEGALDIAKTYVVQVGVVDTLGETDYTQIPVSSEKVYMHRAGSIHSLGIGKYVTEENTLDVAEDITAKFRGPVLFPGEEWLNLGLNSAVAESVTNSGRWGGTGCYYRVCAGNKHIYVAFNCSFATGSSTVRVNADTIPSAYRPNYDVYALCPVGYADGGRGIATVSVSPSGRVNIYAVNRLAGTSPSGETVKWIDGYIDFWT
jgi:hypothetical protein